MTKSTKSKGRFIAVLLIAPAIVWMVNVLFFSPVNNGEKYVDEYINNSVEIEITTDDKLYAFSDGEKFHDRIIYTGIMKVFQRTKMKHAVCKSVMIYGKDHDKYFTLVSMVPEWQFQGLYTGIKGKLITAKINKSQLNDINYGTKENPIPVFMFDIPRYASWDEWQRDKLTEEDYRISVYFYLSYIMPKKEFKKLFKNGADKRTTKMKDKNDI